MLVPFRRSFDRKPRLLETQSLASRRAQRRAALRRRFALELLEGRQMLSTFNVTTASDNGNNASPVPGSLRAEIIAANATPAGTYNTIDFQISGTGLHQIELENPLPAITHPVNINGLSQTGSTATSPLIQIDGASAGSSAFGLDFVSSASGTAAQPTLASGLEITDFAQGGVFVDAASYVELEDLFVGVTTAGGNLAGAGNTGFGVEFYQGTHDTLSGSVVSANQRTGAIVSDTSYATLTGNFIGTDLIGKSPLPNTQNGVLITNAAKNNTVGGTTAAARDIISANGEDGVDITGTGTTGNLVEGDYIGTEVTGMYPLPNYNGVEIENAAAGNTIGGTTTATRDLISGNNWDGVHVVDYGTSANVVEGDYIGVNVGATATLGNAQSGVAIYAQACNNLIGGNVAGSGDVLSGNGANGVYISDGGTTGNAVKGDFIGTNSKGTAALPNYNGVVIQNGAAGNQIGGVATAACDVISGNNWDGVDINNASNNLVEGDDIGVAGGGSTALGNANNGVSIFGAACGNTIGGTVTGSGNVISGNSNFGVGHTAIGVEITDPGTKGNLVEGDFIGTNSSGSNTLGNRIGVLIQNGATKNTIGGTVAGARDVLSGDGLAGVYIAGSLTTGNRVEGDYIGVSPGGTTALGNETGVLIAGAGSNEIGGIVTGARDVISGNFYGVIIVDSGASVNAVQGDYIGTDSTGLVALGNYYGVVVEAGGVDTEIGGTVAGSGNVISGNRATGVAISGASDNLVWGNSIGLSASGAILGNGADGVELDSGACGNIVGGPSTSERNVISGNTGDGVDIRDSGTDGNFVEGNYIGTDSSGSKAMPNYDGVIIQNGASGNFVIGITAVPEVISGNSWDGVHIVGSGTSGNMVEGVYLGVAVGGSVKLPNGASGVAILGGAQGNTIGGAYAGDGDVISGNVLYGVYISSSGTSGNVVEADYIGTDVTGTVALPNYDGVFIGNGTTNNTIGGTTSTTRDIISGNNWDGVHIVYGASDNLVEGDYIGTSASGSAKLANVQSGVAIFAAATNNTIGGVASGTGNVLSGNGSNGVYISDSGTTGNLVDGDYIGTDWTGKVAVPNYDGVVIQNGAANNTIGALTLAYPSDVISGNTWDGVHIVGSGTNANVVWGDNIGTNVSGSAKLGNGASGVAIFAGASNNTVGGRVAIARDVLSGNAWYGVYISDSGTTGNVIANDYIGTDSTGKVALANGTGVYIGNGATNNTIGDAYTGDVVSGNAGAGVFITGSGTTGNVVAADDIGTDVSGSNALANNVGVVIRNQAGANSIGGSSSTGRNVISGNTVDGVQILDAGTYQNVVQDDYIGVNAAGSAKLPNGNNGVTLMAAVSGLFVATGNTIGGTAAGAGNVISGNKGYGVDISGPAVKGNFVWANYIGTNAAGSAALGNTKGGVIVENGAYSNYIGATFYGLVAGTGNVVSGNGGDGILITGSGTINNVVAGNDIGTDVSGTNALRNSNNGIELAANQNTIGGVVTGAGNLIAYNGNNGVQCDTSSMQNVIEYDTIDNNVASGVYFATASAANSVMDCTIENNAFGIYDSGVNNVNSGNTLSGNPKGNYVKG
jgi:hypothetical protein